MQRWVHEQSGCVGAHLKRIRRGLNCMRGSDTFLQAKRQKGLRGAGAGAGAGAGTVSVTVFVGIGGGRAFQLVL